MSHSEQPKLVMIVEDSAMDAYILSKLLKEIGYNSKWADSLEDAYESLKESIDKFDAFIVDYQLREHSSAEFIVELKTSVEFSNYHKKPVILVTSFDKLSLRERDDYKKHLENLIGENLIHKKKDWRSWLQPLLKMLITKFDDSIADINFSELLAEEKIKGYMKFFGDSIRTKKDDEKEINIILGASGVSFINVSFSKPKSLRQALREILKTAIEKLETESEFTKLPNTKKAEILGFHRIKYGRMVKQSSIQNTESKN